MKLHRRIVGCDIAKARIDAFDRLTNKFNAIENAPHTIAAWADRLRPGTLVAFEATGAYDAALLHALRQRAIPFVRVNPRQARDFARASGILAKTDRVDARMLAEMARRLSLKPDRDGGDPEREEIAHLVTRRDQLVMMRKHERTRLGAPSPVEINKLIQEHVAWLSEQIKALDLRIRCSLESVRRRSSEPAMLIGGRRARPRSSPGDTIPSHSGFATWRPGLTAAGPAGTLELAGRKHSCRGGGALAPTALPTPFGVIISLTRRGERQVGGADGGHAHF